MEKNKNKSREGWILPKGERLAYIFGTGATQSFNVFVSSFLGAYLLMIGITPTISAVVVLFVKAWDAINDAIFGFVVDRYRFNEGKNKASKWLFSGRYMPWFRVFFIILPIGMITMFSVNTDSPVWQRIAQYAIGYFIFDTGLTIAASYSLVPLTITNNLEERNHIIAWGGLGQVVGLLPPALLGALFIATTVGYSGSAVIFSILGMLLALLPAIKIKERNVSHPYSESEREKYTLKDALSTFRKVPQVLLLCIGAFLSIVFATDGGYSLFVCYYLFGNATLSVALTAFALVPTFIIVPFLPAIFKRIDKGVVLTISCAITSATSIILYLCGVEFLRSHMIVMYLLYALRATTTVVFSFCCTMIIPDLAEVAKFKMKRDSGGIVSAAHTFSYKLAQGITGSLSLFILGFYGWMSVKANSFSELAALNAQGIGLQTETALAGLWNVFFLIPSIGFMLGAIVFSFIRIKKSHVELYMKANSGEITREECETMINQK